MTRRICFVALLAVLLLPARFLAQDTIKVLMIHPALGEIIDSKEAKDCRVFPSVKDFYSAFFYKLNDTSVCAEVTTVTNNAYSQTTLRFSMIELTQLLAVINRMASVNNYSSERSFTQGADVAVRFSEITPADSLQKTLAKIRTQMIDTLSFRLDNENEMWRLSLTDGSELMGRVIHETFSGIAFKTVSGMEFTVQPRLIDKFERVAGTWKGDQFMSNDPNETRLFFTATGNTLPKGKGYFSIYEIFMPMLAIGVTDYLTIAGGVSLIPGASEQAVYLAPKVRVVNLEKTKVSAGVLYIQVSDVSLGIVYGVGTYGTQKASISAGIGYGFADGDFAKRPVVMVGGELRVSNSVKFISENWFPPKSEGFLYSFGVRFFGEHLAADFGLMGISSSSTEGFPFIPWIGFVYNF
jgi:hypothetical protein